MKTKEILMLFISITTAACSWRTNKKQVYNEKARLLCEQRAISLCFQNVLQFYFFVFRGDKMKLC